MCRIYFADVANGKLWILKLPKKLHQEIYQKSLQFIQHSNSV